jgi:putative sigma-54 modulation protein
MHVNTTARHFELTPVDRSFARERVEKFSRFASDIQEVHLVITAEGYRFVAEAIVRLKQRELAAREEDTEPRRAIESVSERVEQQLRRLHEKRLDRRRSATPNGVPDGSTTDVGEEFEEAGDD